MTIQVEIIGGLIGCIWWPQEICIKSFSASITRERSRIVGFKKATLREVVNLIMMENGGDFQSCQLTDDTVIRVVHTERSVYRGRRTFRDWPETAFPSLRDLVSDHELETLS